MPSVRSTLFVAVLWGLVGCRERAPRDASPPVRSDASDAPVALDAATPVDAGSPTRLRPVALAVGDDLVAYVVLAALSENLADEILPALSGQGASLDVRVFGDRQRRDSSSVVALRPGSRVLRVVGAQVEALAPPEGADSVVLVHGARFPVFSLANDDPSTLRQLVDGAWRAADERARMAIAGSVGGDDSMVASRLSQAVGAGDSLASVFDTCVTAAAARTSGCRAWLYTPPASLTLPAGSERKGLRAALVGSAVAVALREVDVSATSVALEAVELSARGAASRRLGLLATTSSALDERSASERASSYAISAGTRAVLVGWVTASRPGDSTTIRVSSFDPVARRWSARPPLARRAQEVTAVGGQVTTTVAWMEGAQRAAAALVAGRWVAIEGLPPAGEASSDVVIVDRPQGDERPVLFALSSSGEGSSLHRHDGQWSRVELTAREPALDRR